MSLVGKAEMLLILEGPAPVRTQLLVQQDKQTQVQAVVVVVQHRVLQEPVVVQVASLMHGFGVRLLPMHMQLVLEVPLVTVR